MSNWMNVLQKRRVGSRSFQSMQLKGNLFNRANRIAFPVGVVEQQALDQSLIQPNFLILCTLVCLAFRVCLRHIECGPFVQMRALL